MASSDRNPNSPNWEFLESESGTYCVAEQVAVIVAMLSLFNLSRTSIPPPDQEYVATYLLFSFFHMGCITFMTFAKFTEGLFPEYKTNYRRWRCRFSSACVDTANHIVSAYLFLQLTNKYEFTSELYLTYFIRTLLGIIFWYTRDTDYREVIDYI